MDAAERRFGQYESGKETAIFHGGIEPFKRLVYFTTVSIDPGYSIGTRILNYVGKSFIGHCIVLCSVLVWSFSGLGLWVSTTVQNSARATMYLLLIWVAGIALMDFALAGMMLQWRLEPRVVFALAALNPVQSIRMALLSSADPELSVLGPVGFYLANQIGSTGLYMLGVVWPMLLGTLAWMSGLWKLRRGDVV